MKWTVSHDFIYTMGGAEKVTQSLCTKVLDNPDLVYLSGDPVLADSLTRGTVTQILPRVFSEGSYRLLSPIMPPWVQSAPPIEGNLLASSYAFSAGLRATGKKVVYCHSPFRQAWSSANSYAQDGPALERAATRVFGSYFRYFDARSAGSADLFIATSTAVRDRIREYYRLDSVLVPPAFDETKFFDRGVERNEGNYIWVGRVTEPYKKLSVAIEAFRKLPDMTLTVVGDGRDRESLQREAPANVEFLGWKGASEIAELYAKATALIFPSEDDFGIVPIEAMACGLPVIAFGAGGALDTVVNGESGLHFPEQTDKSLIEAIKSFISMSWDSEAISRSCFSRYGELRFERDIRDVLASV